jgi:hypothetical protein
MKDNQTTDDLNKTLAGGFVLFDCTIRKPSFRKPAKELANEVAALHGADLRTVNATKNLLAGADAEYKAVVAAQTAVKNRLVALTTTFSASVDGRKRGKRLAASLKAMSIITELKPLQDVFNECLDTFGNVYTARMQEAVSRANGITDVTEYPDVADIKKLFSVAIDIEPVPAITDFSKASLPVEVAQALGRRMAKRQETAVKNAHGEIIERAVKRVQSMATVMHKKAKGERTAIHKTLLSELQDLSTLMKDMAVVDDGKLAEMAAKIDELTAYNLDQMKNSTNVQAELAEKASKFTAELDPDSQVTPVPAPTDDDDMYADESFEPHPEEAKVLAEVTSMPAPVADEPARVAGSITLPDGSVLATNDEPDFDVPDLDDLVL